MSQRTFLYFEMGGTDTLVSTKFNYMVLEEAFPLIVVSFFVNSQYSKLPSNTVCLCERFIVPAVLLSLNFWISPLLEWEIVLLCI